MADYPPFMNAYGSIPKILAKIRDAKTPPRFTVDFLATNLGFSGGSYRPFIPFAKRIGLLSADGTPTDLYKQFRDPTNSKAAMAEAIRKGYSTLFDRNEYVYKQDHAQLEGLLMQVTGLEKGNTTLKAIANSFAALKSLADFEAGVLAPKSHDEAQEEEKSGRSESNGQEEGAPQLSLSYTIYLNLPQTDDIAVFNAIFKSLRDNLLRK